MDDALRARIARTARFNGGSIVLVAGLAALLAALNGGWGPALFGAAVAAAGAVEHRGGKRLERGAAPGEVRGALVGAELAVLALIVGYSCWRLASADVPAEVAALPADVRAALAATLGGDESQLVELFTLALKLTYGTLIVVTLAYQGGMAWWYRQRLGSAA